MSNKEDQLRKAAMLRHLATETKYPEIARIHLQKAEEHEQAARVIPGR